MSGKGESHNVLYEVRKYQAVAGRGDAYLQASTGLAKEGTRQRSRKKKTSSNVENFTVRPEMTWMVQLV